MNPTQIQKSNPAVIPFKTNDMQSIDQIGAHIGKLKEDFTGSPDKAKGRLLTLDMNRAKDMGGLLTTTPKNGYAANSVSRYALQQAGAMGQTGRFTKIGASAFVIMAHEGEKGMKPYHDHAIAVANNLFGSDQQLDDIAFGANIEARTMQVFAGSGPNNWLPVMVKKAIANAITYDFPNSMAILAANNKIGSALYLSGLGLPELWSDGNRTVRYEFNGYWVIGLTRVAKDGSFKAVLRDIGTMRYSMQTLSRNGARVSNEKQISAAGKIVPTGKTFLIDEVTGHDNFIAAMDMSEGQPVIEVGPRTMILGGVLANA